MEKINHDAEFCMMIDRDKIPLSNIHKLTIEIESFYLPIEFCYEIANLIGKYKPTKDAK